MMVIGQETLVISYGLVVSALAVWAAVWALQVRADVRRDAIRFELFAVRDRLYAAVASGALAADDDWFVETRDMINFLIRESDVAGLAEFYFTMNGSSPERVSAHQKAMRSLPDAKRTLIVRAHVDITRALLKLFQMNSRFVRLLIVVDRSERAMGKPNPTSAYRQLVAREEELVAVLA